MQFEGAASGGVTGLVLSVLAALGLRSDIKRIGEDVSKLKENVIYKDTCKVCADNNLERHREVMAALVRLEGRLK